MFEAKDFQYEYALVCRNLPTSLVNGLSLEEHEPVELAKAADEHNQYLQNLIESGIKLIEIQAQEVLALKSCRQVQFDRSIPFILDSNASRYNSFKYSILEKRILCMLLLTISIINRFKYTTKYDIRKDYFFENELVTNLSILRINVAIYPFYGRSKYISYILLCLTCHIEQVLSKIITTKNWLHWKKGYCISRHFIYI